MEIKRSLLSFSLIAVLAACGGGGGGGDDGGGSASNSPSTPAGKEEETNAEPIAQFSYTADRLAYRFSSAASNDPDGRIASYAWDFGDDNISAAQNPTHTFKPGTYTVTLTVTDNQQGSSTVSQTLTIEAPPAPDVHLTIRAASAKEGGPNAHNEIRIQAQLNYSPITTYRVKYRTIDDDAKGDVDYVSKEGELVFEPGDRQKFMSFYTIGNDMLQPDRRFKVELYEPSEGLLFYNEIRQAFMTIQDDDPVPDVSFSTPRSAISVMAGEVILRAEVDRLSAFTSQFNLTTEGTGRRGADFELNSEMVQIPPMTWGVDIPVSIIDDGTPRGGKTVLFGMNSLQVASPGEISEHSLVITGRAKINDTGVTMIKGVPGEDGELGRDITHGDESDGHAGFSFTKIDQDGNFLPADAGSWSCIQDNVTGAVFEVKRNQQPLPTASTDEEWRSYLTPTFEHQVDTRKHSVRPSYPYAQHMAGTHANWRAANYQYTWYKPDKENIGGSVGAQNERFYNTSFPVSNECAFPHKDHPSYVPVTACNTADYLKVMNTLALCGFKDWRLPDPTSLRSIVNLELDNQLMMDPQFMPHDASYMTGGSGEETITLQDPRNEEISWTEILGYRVPVPNTTYLTSTPSPDNEGSVYCVDTTTGEVKLCHKGIAYPVRAYRHSE